MRHSFILKKNLIFLVIAVCYAQDEFLNYPATTNPEEIEKVFSNIAPDKNLVKAAYDSYNTKKFVTICWIETTTLHLSKTGGQNYGYVQFAISLELTPSPFTVIDSGENASVEPYTLYDKYTKQDRVLNFKTVKETDEQEIKVNRTYICRSDQHYTKTVIKLPQSDKVVVKLKPENLELSSLSVPPLYTGSTRFQKEDTFKYTKEPSESHGTFSQININSKVPLTPQQTSLTWATGDSHTSSLQLGKPATANLQNVKTETGHTTLGSNTGTFQETELASAEATNGHAHQGELGKTSAESEYSHQITSGNKEFRTGEPQETELKSDTSKSEYSEEMKMASDELHSSEFSVGNGSSRILDFALSSESGNGVLKSEISQSITTEQSQTRGGLKIDSSQEGEGESEESQTEIVQETKKESGEFQTGSEMKSREQLIEAGLHKSQSEESQQAEVNSGEALTAGTQPVFAKSETSQIDSVRQGEIRPEESQSESSQSVDMRLGELQSKVDSGESQTESVHSTKKEWGELQYQNAQPNGVIEGELQSGGAQQIVTGPQSEVGSDESQTERVHSTRTEWRELQPQSTRPNSVIGGELQSGGAQQIGTRPQSESQTERVHSTRTEWRELQPQGTRPSSVIGGELQSGGAQQIGTRPQSESQTARVHSTRTEWRELQPQSAQSNSAIREDFTQYSKPIEMGSVEFQNENLQQILMGSDESRTADIQQSGDLKIGDAEKTLATDNSFSTTLEDEILNSEDSIPMDFGSGEMKMESLENEEAGYPQYVPEIVASGEVITDSQSDGSDSQLLKVLTPQKFIGKSSDGRYDGPLSFSRSYPYNFENMDLTSDSNLLGLVATRTPASANLLGLAATRTPAPAGADLDAQRFYPVKIQEPNVPFRVLTDASLGSINQLQIQDQEQQYQFQPKVSECGNDGKVLVKMKMDIMDKDGEIANMEKNIEVDLSSYDTDSNVAGFDKHLALLIRDYYGDRLIRQCKKITKQVSSRKLMNPYLRSYQDVLQNEDEALYPKKQFFYPPSEELGKFYLGPDNRYYIAQHNSNIPAFEKASLFRKISSGIQNAFRFLTNN